MNVLKGKVAVITGSTRGLGLAFAQAFANEGARVVISSRQPGAVDQAVSLLTRQGYTATGLACDVGERDQVEALARHAEQTYGGLDIWVNNAGTAGPYGPTAAIDPEAFVRVVQTNILGTYYGSVAALRRFLPQGSGKLINILGRGDKKPIPLQNAYSASKGWIRSFTIALAKEYASSGVGIFAFNPGLTETQMMEQITAIKGYEARMKPLATVMRMWANPPEVPAQTALYLASPATDGKTGLVVNELGLARLISGAIQELLRRIRGQGEVTPAFQVTTVPPAYAASVPPEAHQAGESGPAAATAERS